MPPTPHAPLAPKRRRRWLKLTMFAVAILFAVTLGAIASTAFLAKEKVDRLLTPKTAQVRAAQKQLAAPLPGKPANILIMGSDHRAGYAENDRRSDTLILVRLDPQGKTISMLSFPRDLYVDIPGHGQSRINDAYPLGGPKLSVETVKKLTGLDVNFIMTVDFRGFRQIVDAVGGVYVDVDRRYFNDNSGGSNYAAINVSEGYQLLKGRDALAYARFRHTDSDFHRIARQQLMLAAMKKQVGKSRIARNLPALFDALYKNTDMATGGNGKISSRQVIDYMRLALTLRGKNVYQVEVTGEPTTTSAGASVVQAEESAIRAAVDAFLKPDKDAQEATADQVTGAKSAATPKPTTPDPSTVQLEVKNGNGIPGSAGESAVALRRLGYVVTLQDGPAGNADRQDYTFTRVQYRRETDRATAEKIAASFDGATVEPMTAANATAARILVIVGKSGSTASTAAEPLESNRVPEKKPPRVVTDARYGLDEFQRLIGKTKVPLLYPTVREQTTVYETPLRGYEVAKEKQIYDAYRLVGRTGSGDYWGLQGTTWPDPPLIDDPTRTITRNGREYMLFLNGTKLHVVAWRQNGAVYWVSNSVLDKLSNETMLAIALGVKPVPRR